MESHTVSHATKSSDHQSPLFNFHLPDIETLRYFVDQYDNLEDKPVDGRCYVCNICKIAFQFARELDAHMLVIHIDEGTMKCRHCNEQLRLHSSKKHMKIHTSYLPYKCPDCETIFKEKVRYVRHKQHPAGSFKCLLCNKAFTRSVCLDEHMVVHNGPMPYKCITCHRSFSRIGSLESHVKKCKKRKSKERLMHEDREHSGKPFHCVECGKQFKNYCQLIAHAAINPTNRYTKSPIHKCRDCKKEFTRINCLLSHQMMHFCDIVNHKRNLSQLENKENIVFKKQEEIKVEGDVMCQACGKVFLSNDYLVTHLRCCGDIHTTQNNKDNIKSLAEIKATIEGHREQKCLVCGKKFLDYCSLNLHLHEHTKEVLPDNTKETVTGGDAESAQPIVDNVNGETEDNVNDKTENEEKIKVKKEEQCYLCGCRFPNYNLLVNHVREHTKVKSDSAKHSKEWCENESCQVNCTDQRTYHICCKCGKEFYVSVNFFGDSKSKSDDEAYIKCVDCILACHFTF